MNQQIIYQYEISFQNKVYDWEISGKEIGKVISTNNINLTNFLICWDSISEIDDSLLTDIEESLANPTIEVNSDSPTVNIIMSNNLVDFYIDDGYANSIPLQDFKEIVIGWRDFLLTPPLNGAKVS